jgi:hypothetical protein
MNRRNIFKLLPAAPVKVAKAAAADLGPQRYGIGLVEWLTRQQEIRAEEAIKTLAVAQRADCVVVHNVTTGSYNAMTKEDYTAERRQNCLFGPTPGALA